MSSAKGGFSPICPTLPYPGSLYLSSWDHLSLLLQFVVALSCLFALLDTGILGPRPKLGTANGQLCSSPHHRASSQAGPGNCSQSDIGISGLRASCRGSRRGPGQLPRWEGRGGYLRPGAAPGYLQPVWMQEIHASRPWG